MTESELRKAVVDLAHAAGWRVFSLPIAKTRRPVKDAVGYPDLTLAKIGFAVIWMELKTEDGVLSHDQMQWKRDLGLNCIVVRPSDLGLVAEMLA